MKNWWYYHKWQVAGAAALLALLLNWLWDALGIFEKTPDYQIAYVGKELLSPETAEAIEESFAAVSKDFNGDGEVLVELRQYLSIDQSQAGEIDYEGYASDVSLVGDISNCESYFFIMDDPGLLQERFHILASTDGGCPTKGDDSVDGKVISWEDCQIFRQLEQEGSVNGSHAGGDGRKGRRMELYIGRRCFYGNDRTDYAGQCGELWELFQSM